MTGSYNLKKKEIVAWNNSLKFCRKDVFSIDIAFRIYHEYTLLLQFDCKLEANIVGDSGK